MLILRPRGRGNWRPTTVRIDGRLGMIDVRVGQLLTLGGVTFRVCQVLP